MKKGPSGSVTRDRSPATASGFKLLRLVEQRSLTWLVNEVSSFGPGFAAGQVVTTNTCTVPLPIEHQHITIGGVRLHIAEAGQSVPLILLHG